MRLLVAANNVLPQLPDQVFIEVEGIADIQSQMGALECSLDYVDRVCTHISKFFEDEYLRAVKAQSQNP